MNKAEDKAAQKLSEFKLLIFCFIIGTFLVYFFSNPKPQYYYDYTFRVAENFLYGQIAFTEKPPSWLNEFVPFQGFWYSVFPLGSVLTMIPFAFLKFTGIIREMPAAFIGALTASLVCLFLFLISNRYDHAVRKRLLLISGILFGSWMWTNLAMAGAWQLTLGWALVGELGAIYFTVFNRKPLLAGAFFALAFGNRTEVLPTAPVFMFLLLKNDLFRDSTAPNEEISKSTASEREQTHTSNFSSPRSGFLTILINNWKPLAKFCLAPFLLGVLTLIYNYVRFHSVADFGHARIPGVLDEPWYNYGIFSVWYIPGQAWEMLWKPWESRSDPPFFVPNGFSSSILWSSPFLLFALRFGARDKMLKYSAWAAILIVTLLLWMHGNSGGWQFGYRYAMLLLPWLFIILLENSPKKINRLEWAAYGFSIVVNAWATYLFFWTAFVKP